MNNFPIRLCWYLENEREKNPWNQDTRSEIWLLPNCRVWLGSKGNRCEQDCWTLNFGRNFWPSTTKWSSPKPEGKSIIFNPFRLIFEQQFINRINILGCVKKKKKKLSYLLNGNISLSRCFFNHLKNVQLDRRDLDPLSFFPLELLVKKCFSDKSSLLCNYSTFSKFLERFWKPII